jgi:hypothetical protein
MVHDAKVISYLRTTGLRLGLLLNFNCRTMKEVEDGSSCSVPFAGRPARQAAVP